MIRSYMKPQTRYRVFRLFFIVSSVGVMIHELAHKWFAEDSGLEIFEVDLFSLNGEQLGKVVHEEPQTYRTWFAVSVAPFLVNSSLSIASFTGIGVIIRQRTLHISTSIPSLIVFGVLTLLTWFGMSTAVHAFPSPKDIENVTNVKYNIWEASKIPLIQPKFMSLYSRGWVYKLTLAPIWIVIRSVQTIVYTIRSPLAVLTIPFILFLKLCNRTRRWGSEFVYTGMLAVLSYQYIPYANRGYEILIGLL